MPAAAAEVNPRTVRHLPAGLLLLGEGSARKSTVVTPVAASKVTRHREDLAV